MIKPSPNSLRSFSLFIITTHVLLHNNLSLLISREDTPKLGYSLKERDSLYALKSSLDNPLLNSLWLGPHCEANASKWFGIRCNSNGQVTEIVLENLGLRATIGVNALTSFTELCVLSFKNNSLGKTLIDFSSNRKLTRVNLSGNLFSGPIPVSLVEIPGLESVLLENNFITGPIPEFNQSSLREFNVSSNDLIGSIPKTRVLQSFSSETYNGNPRLCGKPSPAACEAVMRADSPQEALAEGKTRHQTSFVDYLKRYLLVFDFVLLVVVVFLFIWYFKKVRNLKKTMRDYLGHGKEERRELEIVRQVDHQDRSDDQQVIKIKDKKVDRDHQRRSSSSSSIAINNNTTTTTTTSASTSKFVDGKETKDKLIFFDNNQDQDHNDHQGNNNSIFEMSELFKASAEGLGHGTFGNCYKAMMEGKAAVVVKRLRNLKPMTADEFEKQLRLIAEQKHPNLLPLLAYYNANDEKLLVYKYVERGNLFDRIHGGRGVNGSTSKRVPFQWRSRLSVARGVARALSHLHRNMPSTLLVPHGNLKSTNVLLGPDDTALVSDYGLASIVALPHRTASYRSPEYSNNLITPSTTDATKGGRVSKKSDVWSYGCLLLELLTGKVSAHTAPPGARGADLAGWVHKAVREEWTAEIFDREIFVNRHCAVPGALRLLEIAMRCVERSPEKRLDMEEVARQVEEIQCLANQSDQGEDVESSLDRSLTDDNDSMSTVASGASGDRDRIG